MGLGLMPQDFGARAEGLEVFTGFGGQVSAFQAADLVSNSRHKIRGREFKVQDASMRLRVSGWGFEIQCLGYEGSGSLGVCLQILGLSLEGLCVQFTC